MAKLSPLEQVKLDAERITLKRIQDAKEAKAWQESQKRTVTFEEPVEAVVEVSEVVADEPVAPKAVKTKKGK